MGVTKRIYLLSVIMSAVFLFTACGKAKKDDIANDLKRNAGMETSDGNVVEEDEASEIPDTISYVVMSGEGRQMLMPKYMLMVMVLFLRSQLRNVKTRMNLS